MKKYWFLILGVTLTFLLITEIQAQIEPIYTCTGIDVESKSSIKGVTLDLVRVNITITCPNGFSMLGKTPIIINLSQLAKSFPPVVDPFGLITPSDPLDDIKWESSYVTYDGELLPSQVDDVDKEIGYSEADELLFQLPEAISLASGESISFIICFSTIGLNLQAPYFPEVCEASVYPKIDEIIDMWGGMLSPGDSAYYIENGIIQACALVEAAWSSGGIYELSILDEDGNSQWDAIKQKYEEIFNTWRWSRFALIEQFISKNLYPDTNPFKLEHIITGPVRVQFQMQSISDYGKGGTPWGNIPNIYGLVTYDLYANQPFLDYTLEIVGPDANKYPSLIIQYQNREWGGRPGSPYKSIYVPGQDWLLRNPNDVLEHTVGKADFNESWYLEGLDVGQEISPPSFAGSDDDQLGYGFIFDNIGFSNIIWKAGSEDISNWYDACQFPFRTRYCPFDASILAGQDRISYMEDRYQERLCPKPELTMNATIISLSELPFKSIFVTKPDVIFDNVTDLLQIVNISAYSTVLTDFLTNTTPSVSATYNVLFVSNKSKTGLNGNLVWDDVTNTWGASDIDLSSLDLTLGYVVTVSFESDGVFGQGPPSEIFFEVASPDINPPIVRNILLFPSTDPIISTDIVNVSCVVTEEEGRVTQVILSYHNGSWYNVTMEFKDGFYFGSIPPQNPGTTVKLKIIAIDDSGNSYTSEVLVYQITEIEQTETITTTTETSVGIPTPGFTMFSVLTMLGLILIFYRKRHF